MTREQTIMWLDSLKKDIGQSQHQELWHYAEALDVAIELLSTKAKTKCVAQIKVDTEEVVRRIKEEYDITDGWIPCSERLPSEYGEYLATVDGETIEVSYVPRTKGLINGWSTCDTYGYKRLSDDDVIAWRPLPRPYKESEVEE